MRRVLQLAFCLGLMGTCSSGTATGALTPRRPARHGLALTSAHRRRASAQRHRAKRLGRTKTQKASAGAASRSSGSHANASSAPQRAGGALAKTASAVPPVPASAAAGATPTAPPQLIWSDDFTGPAGSPPDPSKWTAVTGGDGWGNQELEYYTDRTSNVALDGAGHLDITARDETYTGPDGVSRDYTSARLQTKGHFDFQYGEVDARIQLPQGEGLWPAFWGLGSNIDSVRWPWCGEFDVMENLGSPYTIYGSVHGTVGHTAATTEVSTASSLAAGYHVYGMIWSPDSVTLTLDGDPYASYSPASLPSGNAWEFDSGPFYLLLDLAVGGWAGTPSPATPFPATMSVDWVRVYN